MTNGVAVALVTTVEETWSLA